MLIFNLKFPIQHHPRFIKDVFLESLPQIERDRQEALEPGVRAEDRTFAITDWHVYLITAPAFMPAELHKHYWIAQWFGPLDAKPEVGVLILQCPSLSGTE